MDTDGWLALLIVGLFTLIGAPMAFQANPSDLRIALFAMVPPILLAALVMMRKRPLAARLA
ncbi:MAG: hypothetical protein ACPHID_01295 [Thermoplasmatota archaeon]